MMQEASEALVQRRYFECQALCEDSLTKAHSVRDYDRMARVLMPLQESRRLIRQLAVDAGAHGSVTIVDSSLPEKAIEPGCYLVAPPRVGVDGRTLREAATKRETPAMVLVREPTTRDGMWPLVAVGPVTVRTRVTPPGKGEWLEQDVRPGPAWFERAAEALGDAAITGVQEGNASGTGAGGLGALVDALMERLTTLPDHEKLHQRLQEACRAALLEPRPTRRPKKAVVETDAEEDDDE